MLYKIFTVLLLLFISSSGFTQDQKVELNKSRWEKITKKTDYTERYKERKPRERKPRKQRNRGNGFSGFKLQHLRILIWAIIVGLLVYVLFLLLKRYFHFFSDKKDDGDLEYSVQNLEDNFHNTDFEALLSEAVNKGEFRLAVRIFYIHILKLLSDKDFIHWKREKTNGCYVRELRASLKGTEFAYLTSIYEQTWFGDYEVNYLNFKIISRYFNRFINQVP